MSNLRLFRLDVDVAVGSAGAFTCYLVVAESPAAAANLAIERAKARWAGSTASVLRCWAYPAGELVLGGAHTLDVAGELLDVADLGAARTVLCCDLTFETREAADQHQEEHAASVAAEPDSLARKQARRIDEASEEELL